MPNTTQPTLYLSHGGGPWPWLKKEMPFFTELERSLLHARDALPSRPKAILVISGHWEEDEFSVSSNPYPSMIYDYGGFPEFTYGIKYSAPGEPALAKKVQELLLKNGISARLDEKRGFDHGTFSVLYPMFPNADVPVVQLSMRSGYDPQKHLAAGRALSSLRTEGVLIVGSGSSFHDLRMPAGATKTSHEFDSWLFEALTKSDSHERTKKLVNWLEAPSARAAHPREDHLIPLHVAVGAAESEPAQRIYAEAFLGRISMSSYRFG